MSDEAIHSTFRLLIYVHMVTGAIGVIAFWVPIFARKGGIAHRQWGKIFIFALFGAAGTAALMSCMTIAFPGATHPHLASHPDFSNPQLIRAIFGWMMLYLVILTFNLLWYGWLCIANKANHRANAAWHNLALQALLLAAALNCAIRGLVIGQPLMIGISTIGFATVATNLYFIAQRRPAPLMWLREHVKAIVGAGISVYTAFFAFGAVRFVPELALAPALWAVPLVTGLAIIIYQQRRIARGGLRARA